MTPYQTLAVAVRLFAIWLFLYATSQMASSYVDAHQYNSPDSWMPLIFGFFVIVSVCIVLLFFPVFIAKRILPTSALSGVRSPTFDSWFTVGCSLIGVWVLAKAIPALVSYGLGYYLRKMFSPDTFMVDPHWGVYISFNVFQLVIGIWLFMGGTGLKKVFDWARHA
jgi:hypothetical protein